MNGVDGSELRGAPERGPQAPQGAALSDVEWRHRSGVILPRGSVVLDVATDEELEDLRRRSDERGAVAAQLTARKVKRSKGEEAQLQAFCEWLDGHSLDILGTVTYSDDYAASHGIYSLRSALRDVRRGLAQVPMKRGRIRGFRGKFVAVGEWHPSGRQVPHVHVALDSMGAPIEKICVDLWRYFYNTRGRSRFEPMRDQTQATLYGLKDTVKSSEKDATSLEVRLTRPRCFRGRR